MATPLVDLRRKAAGADAGFRGLAVVAALMVLAILGLIAVTMGARSTDALQAMGIRFFTTKRWSVTNQLYGAGALVFGTLLTSLVALVMSVPVSIGIALFVTQVVPTRFRRPIVYVVDLLAVIPSVVFGLWGISFLAPKMVGFYRWMHAHFGGIPVAGRLFGPATSGRNFFTASIILAIMITPIITSLSREVIDTTPAGEREAALALGATRWEMIRGSVLPHSKGGLVGAVMLGLGRAMGETIAVTLVIGNALGVIGANLFASGNSLPAIIATDWGEADTLQKSALIALAMTLFAMTLLINFAAVSIVNRSLRRSEGS
jgi:phosphate transport system permease protein